MVRCRRRRPCGQSWAFGVGLGYLPNCSVSAQVSSFKTVLSPPRVFCVSPVHLGWFERYQYGRLAGGAASRATHTHASLRAWPSFGAPSSGLPPSASAPSRSDGPSGRYQIRAVHRSRPWGGAAIALWDGWPRWGPGYRLGGAQPRGPGVTRGVWGGTTSLRGGAGQRGGVRRGGRGGVRATVGGGGVRGGGGGRTHHPPGGLHIFVLWGVRGRRGGWRRGGSSLQPRNAHPPRAGSGAGWAAGEPFPPFTAHPSGEVLYMAFPFTPPPPRSSGGTRPECLTYLWVPCRCWGLA
jgi:hypothetical protein